MPANILNLPDYKVVWVEEADHDYHVYAEASNQPSSCTACGSDRLIGHGRNEQVIRDLPTHGKRLAIYVDTRRWRCQSCGKTFMEALPAVNTKREMTDRLVRWIGQQSLKQTFASIADDTGLGWHAPVHIHLERSTLNAASLLTERLRLFCWARRKLYLFLLELRLFSQKTARRTFLFATNFAVSHQFPSP